MKAALNGVPSLSVLDGWWIEGCAEDVTGWAIDDGDTDSAEATSLYDKLEQRIAPAYAKPNAWARIQQHSIAMNGSFFNTDRNAGAVLCERVLSAGSGSGRRRLEPNLPPKASLRLRTRPPSPYRAAPALRPSTLARAGRRACPLYNCVQSVSTDVIHPVEIVDDAISREPWKAFQVRHRSMELKRDAVLLTAAHLFLEHGYQKTSMSLLAARLNITKPALYYYFRNKEEILVECYRAGIANIEGHLDRSNRSTPGSGDWPCAAAALRARVCHRNPDYGVRPVCGYDTRTPSFPTRAGAKCAI